MQVFTGYDDVKQQGLGNKINKARKITLTRVIKMGEPFQCVTMEGLVEGKAGDYLAIGAKDEVYPIAAEVFEVTYEIVEKSREEIIQDAIVLWQIHSSIVDKLR